MKNALPLIFLLWAGVIAAKADTPPAATTSTDSLYVFRFRPGDDMFILEGNGTVLAALYRLIDEVNAEITDGKLPIYVDGYCASLPTRKENLATAFIRANRVKSELIVHKGLKESDFVTANYAHAYKDNDKDMVVVTLRIPVKAAAETQPVEEEAEKEEDKQTIPSVSVEQKQETVMEGQQEPVMEQPAVRPESPYRFAVRTNLLYDAFLLPTLGIEWRVNRNVGIKLDGSLSWWSGADGKVQKMWLLNPEVRWYMGGAKRFYAGLSANYGEYNLYKYMLGGFLSDDAGYQGRLWSAGLTAGYQLFLSRRFSIDINIGLGYTRSDYDSFTLTDGVRVYKHRDKTKDFWGPTQAGISLVWTLGSSKLQ